MYDRPNEEIIRKMRWAHRGLEYTYRAKGLEFNDMSFHQYVAGETKIIAMSDEDEERNGRLRLMNKIAYAMDETSNWLACRQYYAAVVVAIEMGEEEWVSNFRRFENMLPKVVIGAASTIRQGQHTANKSTNPKSIQGKSKSRRIPEVCFCKEYNRGDCTQESPHLGKYKDEIKPVMLHHYCAKCLLKSKIKMQHPENSEACPYNRQ